MQPLAAAPPRERGCPSDELSSDAASTVRDIDSWIEQERVLPAIGRDVHKSDELIRREGSDDAKTVSEHGRPLALRVIVPGACEEIVERRIIERRIDAIIHHRYHDAHAFT